MKTIGNELNVFCDIDNTLLIWDREHLAPGHGKLELNWPYDDTKRYLTPHRLHCQLVKDYAARGYTIVAWSGNGKAWVEEAIKKLELEKHVSFGMSKPIKFMDDLEAHEVLGTRVFLKDY